MVANGFDGVPWMLSGALHSANVGRLVAHWATSGQEGVAAPGDLKVTATPGTPDGNVHMAAGAVAIRNRAAGINSEMYAERASQVSDIPISSTAGSARSDLIVVRVEDPEFPPFNASPPTDPEVIDNGPYVFPRVISGVSSSITRADQLGGIYANQSLYAVARIDLPAGTTNITDAMIKDLRKLAKPRELSDFFVTTGPAVNEQVGYGQTSYFNWPSTSRQVTVPDWATHALVGIGLDISVGDPIGLDIRVDFGGIKGPATIMDYNGSGGVAGAETIQTTAYADLDITSLRGQTVTVRTNTRRSSFDENTGIAAMDTNSQVTFDIRFKERVV